MKRSVMAAIISATLLASCTWMPDFWETDSGKDTEPEIPMDEVLGVEELIVRDFTGDTVWVRGFIVGGLSADASIDFGCQGDVLGTAVILADDTGCTEPDDCLALQLTKKAHKEALGLDRPANRDAVLHREIFVRGKTTTYKGYHALTNLSEYKLE